jgi:hypothetical protein
VKAADSQSCSDCYLLVTCLAYSSSLKIEAIFCPETSFSTGYTALYLRRESSSFDKSSTDKNITEIIARHKRSSTHFKSERWGSPSFKRRSARKTLMMREGDDDSILNY